MAETLVELVARIKADATALEAGLTDAEHKTEASSKKMADSLKKVGIAMAASGAAITAALGLMGKAAIDEDINIKRLAISLKNVGINYDDVKDSLEGVISATQRKTGIADNEQRDALNELVLVTGDYQKALEWLPTVLDMAAAKQMDATTAARLLGRAALGNTEMLTRYGIVIKEGATETEILTEIQKKFAGAAESTANPLKILSASMGDVSESIGSFLIPSIKNFVNIAAAASDGIQNWIKLNPELAEGLVLATAKLGGLLLVVGSLILVVPKIIGFITVITGLMGPWGWAILAVSVVVGFLVANLLGLSDVMTGLKGIMADVQKQMFVMQAQQSLSADEWKKIEEQGYLTEEQFGNLAKAMKLTTTELYNQMQASDMLQASMTAVGDTNIYLKDTTEETSAEVKDLTDQLKNATNAAKEFNWETEATKQAIARATWQADGYTYSMQLFTQKEIDAAKASGKKVEELKAQSEITEDNTKKARDYAVTIDNASESVTEFKDNLKDSKAQEDQQAIERSNFAARAGAIHPELLPELEAAWARTQAALTSGNLDEYFRIGKEELQPLQKEVWGYQKGGVVPGPVGMPQLAMVHGGEAIIPNDEMWGGVVNIYIDSFTANSERDVDNLAEKIVKLIRARTGLK